MNYLIPLMVVVPIFAALILNLFAKQNKLIKYLALVVGIVLPIIPLVSSYGIHFFGGHSPLINSTVSVPSYISNSVLNIFHPAITYSFGGLEKIFLFSLGIVAFIAILTYINTYKKASGPYLFLIFMGTAAVSAIMVSDDIFNMYVFFEIAALTQTGILLASKTEDNYETALKYMILSSIGGPMLLLGIGFLLGVVGSVNITDIVYVVSHGLLVTHESRALLLFAFGLIFFGVLYASGLPPFNIIKSSVYSKADFEGASLLQAFSVVTLIGFILAIFRIFFVFSIVQWVVIIFALAAMILGVVMALVQNDFRRMLAYLAVGELGFVLLGIGIGTQLSMTAGLFQAVNEIFITALLFLGLGSAVYLAKTSDTNKLGGLIAYHPKMAIMVLLGGFAMAGVPPFNGFRSKLMLVQAAINAGYPELAIIAVLVSIVTFMVFVKVFHSIYLKPKPNDLEMVHDSIPKSLMFGVGILLIICIVLGIFPELVTNTISQVVGGLL